jgi:hypothetical protein
LKWDELQTDFNSIVGQRLGLALLEKLHDRHFVTAASLEQRRDTATADLRGIFGGAMV